LNYKKHCIGVIITVVDQISFAERDHKESCYYLLQLLQAPIEKKGKILQYFALFEELFILILKQIVAKLIFTYVTQRNVGFRS